MTATIKITRRCNIRNFDYVAVVREATGKLVGIAAGCRNWTSFEIAQQHYREGKWQDVYLGADISRNNRMWAFRYEARCLLSKLEEDVLGYVEERRIKRRRARKAKAAQARRP